MKKLFLLTVLTFISHSILHSQGCLPEGITFTNQAQIDNFQKNYPGCTQIMGNVKISGNDIINLKGLSQLTFFGGMVEIVDNSSLTSLSGLEKVYEVHWHLRIRNNTALTSLNGLKDLTWIGGDFGISFSDALTDLTGLEALTGVGLGLSIGSNHSLISIAALDKVTSVGEKLWINDNIALTNLAGLENIEIGSVTDLTISDNKALSDCKIQPICNYLANPKGSINIYNNAPGCSNPLEAAAACGVNLTCLPYGNYYLTNQAEIDNFTSDYFNCKKLAGNLTIRGNNILNLNGLNNITSVGGGVEIFNNASLISLDGLNGLTWIGKSLVIRQDSALLRLSGLEALTTIGGYLEIENNKVLASLSGLKHVISVGGDLHVLYNNELTNLAGLNSLKTIGRLCWISQNPSLKSLAGLDSLTSVGETLQIDYNDSLMNLEGLEELTKVGRGFLIMGNNAMTTISDLKSLTTIGTNIEIYGNEVLTSLSGLEKVTTIGGHLWISTNPLMTSLAGLNGLTSIGGYLWIWDNASLVSLNGINNIDAGSINELSIFLNPFLSSCEVESVCAYLAKPDGKVEIFENAPRCNSKEEVKAACAAVGVWDVDNLRPAVGSFPNPFSDIINIEYTLEKFATVNLAIFNLYGQEIKILVNEPQPGGTHLVQWNADGLPEGIYFYRLQAGNQVSSGKIIKIQKP